MKAVLFCFFFLISLRGWAADDTSEETPPTSISSLKVGAGLSYYRYVEPGLISHTGMLIGAWANWDYKLMSGLKGQIFADLMTGTLNYDGAICDIKTNACTSYKAKTNLLLLKTSHRFTYQLQNDWAILTGLGYRYLFDKGEGPAFYRRIGNYVYLPVGFNYQHAMDERAVLSFDFEYDYFLTGQMESKLSDVNSTWDDVRHKQNKGSAYKIAIGYEPLYLGSSTRPVSVYLVYEYWSIADSDSAELIINGKGSGNYFIEPKNFSELIALKAAWSY
jgi:hypothetical protein